MRINDVMKELPLGCLYLSSAITTDIRPALSSYSLSTNAHSVKLYIVHFNLLSTIAHCVIFIFSDNNCMLRHLHFVCRQLNTMLFPFCMSTLHTVSFQFSLSRLLHIASFLFSLSTATHFSVSIFCQQLHTVSFPFSVDNYTLSLQF